MKETIMRMCVVAHFALGAIACNGPMAMLPGGELSGPVESTHSWAFASEFESLELETRPEDPYSVRIGFVLRDGALYIDPAEERRWYQYLKDDANVRVRFAEVIYPATAFEVTADEEKAGFDPTRHVFRLEPST
jgi:hypothetical protein